MIRSEFVTEIALMIGHTDGAYDSNIVNWINWGMYYLDRQCDFKGLRKRVKFPFVVGQTEYAFPSDLKYPKALTLLDHLMESIAESSVNTTTDKITVANDISTGTKVQFLNSDPPGGLTAFTFYYVINVSPTIIQLATTSALATAGTAIDLTGTGTGPHILEIYNGTDSRKLEYILEEDFTEHVSDITERSSNKPSLYIDKGDIFEIGRPINEALCGELVYWKWQDALVADGSEPEVSHIEDLICISASVFAWRVLEEVEKKLDAIKELNVMLAGHMKVLNRHPDEFLSDKGFRFGNVPGRGNMGGYIRGSGYKYPGVK
jgi:hypothetical protein